MSIFIQIVLYTTIVAQLSLVVLLLSSRRNTLVRWVIIALSLACVVWPAGVLSFLTNTNDIDAAVAVVKLYYIDGAIIGTLLIFFAHLLPYKREISINLVLWILAGLGAISVIILMPNGMIESVHLVSNAPNYVTFNPEYYLIYCVFFTLVSSVTFGFFTYGYRQALKQGDKQIAAQTRTLIIGLFIALIMGLWFNVILPGLGDYDLIWLGPPFTLLFVIAMFYSIIGQGLFDLRAALARSSAYLLLLITMVVAYSIIIFTVTDLLFRNNVQRGTLITYVILALFFTITYSSIKKFFDQLTYRFFYQDDYDVKDRLAKFTLVTSEALQLEHLVRSSLEVLQGTLAADYISAYVTDSDGRLRHFTVGPNPPTVHQRRLQLDVVGTILDRLPRVMDAHDSELLDESGAKHQIGRAEVSMILQFVAQKEHIGALFVGDKQNGSKYNDKDMQLLTTATDELALAIQNSQRFEEIEHFNETLQSKVDDATKRLRHSNLELQKLDKAKDEFVSLASHQLRTPLTSIKGYLSIVLEGDTGKINSRQRKVLEQAYASSERMVRLIADFLSVSRLQTEKFTIERSETDINRIVEQTVASLQPIAAENKQKMSFTGVINKRTAYVDAAKIQQVVMNYIDNAIYYSNPNTKIEVLLEYKGNDAVLTVTDDGIGVPRDEHARLFTKFYRAKNARQQRPDGTGVGLYLVKKIVNAHGGSIIFQSTEGKGSTFGFRMPLGTKEDLRKD